MQYLPKITQKQLAFYKLYQEYKKDKTRYVDTWEFVGETPDPCTLTGKYELMSYKCPTRLTDIYQENVGLLVRRLHTGKSGSQYYQYKFADNVTPNLIQDASLRIAHKLLK
jgi:hypothetical protein